MESLPFQIGIFVQNLEAAMNELGGSIGLDWSAVRERELDEGGLLRVVFSIQGPLHIELIEGPPGSAWDSTGGPRVDHLGYWSDDFPADRDRLQADGLAVVRGNDRRTHHQTAHGIRIELFDASNRADFYRRWQIGGEAETTPGD